jgi:pyridoxamine 5'-phosphate oxidase
MVNSFANIRKDYKKFALDEKHLHENPFEQFSLWMDDVIKSGVEEPTAMVLSTVSSDNRPSSRLVLLKEVTVEGFVFFTNYHSRKGLQLAQNPNASLLFFWKELERQVRIEGNVKLDLPENSDAYFLSRPLESRISAMVSPQSHKIESRKGLEDFHEKLLQEDKVLTRPTHWGGYVLIPDYFEFWQGRENRLHDRVVYEKTDESWEKFRLAP